MAKTHEMNLTEGPMLRKLIVYAVPLMLSGMLQLLFNTVDVIVVGKLVDEAALAAVGSFTPTANALTGCCVFRLIWIFTVFQSYHTLECLYLVYPISWSITAIAHFVAFVILFRRLRLQQEGQKK